jgi:hypothetical protein
VTRSIVNQTVAELGGTGSVLARQRRDHIELDRLLRELDCAAGPRQEEVLQRVNRLVFPHAFAEEAVLWPVFRRVLPEGDALTRLVEEEHQEANELVAALERDGPDHPRRSPRLARLAEVLMEDVRDEEDVLLPLLQETLEPAELRRLGREWELARRVSPTRPHPTVSRRPSGSALSGLALSGLPLTVLDRTRDLVDAGLRRAPEQIAPVGRAVGRGLAELAGLVERIPTSR